MNAVRTYLTGFGHEVAHDEYVTLGEYVGEAKKSESDLTENERAGIELLKEERKEVEEKEKGEVRPIWLRPAHDGLRIRLTAQGEVKDYTYDS